MIRVFTFLLFAFCGMASAQTSSTERTIDEIMSALASGQTANISAQDLRDAVDSLDSTGWAQYADTQYPCAGTPFNIVANTDTALPNNAGAVIEAWMPDDVTTFYDGTVITGRTGDGILITVDMTAVPTAGATTYIEVWIDIGGTVGPLYRRIISFPKGTGEIRPVNFTVAGYTLGTWQANGGTVYVRTNGAATACDIRYVITRTHRGTSDIN